MVTGQTDGRISVGVMFRLFSLEKLKPFRSETQSINEQFIQYVQIRAYFQIMILDVILWYWTDVSAPIHQLLKFIGNAYCARGKSLGNEIFCKILII